jgi:hypothetical protein
MPAGSGDDRFGRISELTDGRGHVGGFLWMQDSVTVHEGVRTELMDRSNS